MSDQRKKVKAKRTVPAKIEKEPTLEDATSMFCSYIFSATKYEINQIMAFGGAVYQLSQAASQEQKDKTLSSLLDAIAQRDITSQTSVLLTITGALCEIGANVDACAPTFLKILNKHLVYCRDAKRNKQKTKANAECLGPPVQAILGRSRTGRDLMRSDVNIISLVNELRWGYAKMLHRFVTEFDDQELYVIHLEDNKGFKVVISGITDNDQLQGLLADRLIRQLQALKGRPPHPNVVAVLEGKGPVQIDKSIISVWDLYNWPYLQPDGSVNRDTSMKIWGEGVPADIATFSDKRVVFLAPLGYQRSTNACRMFPSLEAKLDVIEQLSTNELQNLLNMIKTAPSSQRTASLKWIEGQNNPPNAHADDDDDDNSEEYEENENDEDEDEDGVYSEEDDDE